ncbi:FtsX-like permease family protein [Cryobacterium psychrophilum]|uniref:ABC transporter permease n=1 Tax=Cryobacterium psychrophilum TaxID=41988 RepID=A0A4Y8KPA8_9MICO|nr:FtsX-like permease family protein [Cryobacterium psychrophilum]TDW28587.1 FtsX-like permease family protein [Cryobacterium psychrophilum]TFD80417.1 ABC transporter permease [Cryobacterium psychrophilum]
MSARLAFRMARRMATQSPVRSLLVAVLVAIPVLGMAGIATVSASNIATPAEHATLQLGSTEARLRVMNAPDPAFSQDPLNELNNGLDATVVDPTAPQSFSTEPVAPDTYLPADTRVLTINYTSLVAETADGIGSFDAVQGQPWDEAFDGKWSVIGGTTPQTDHEIMVTEATLGRLGAHIGSTVDIRSPQVATFRIVGTLSSARLDNAGEGFYGRPGVFDAVLPSDDLKSTEFYLPDLRLTWSAVQDLNRHGATVLSRAVLLHPPAPGSYTMALNASTGTGWLALYVALLGGFALFEVALLAGAAFTVGARSQQRTLATLASVGGDKRMLFRVMSFGGVILGAVGAVLGTALGVATAWIFMQISANGSAARYPGFHVDPVVLSGIAAVAILAGWIAAAVPARAASRVDIIGALRGSERPPKLSQRRPVVGLVVMAVGAVIAVAGGLITLAAYTPVYQANLLTLSLALIVIGPVSMQIGAVLIAPLILRWGARLLSRVGPGARLGTRDVARNPGRSVPALAAIMSTVFVASFAMSMVGMAQAHERDGYVFDAPLNAVSVTMYTAGAEAPYKRIPRTGSGEVAAAMQAAFPSGTARVLSSAPDPALPFYEYEKNPTVADATFAYPRVNPATVCPSDAMGGMRASTTPNDIRCPTPGYLATNTYGANDHIWVGSPADLAVLLDEPVSEQSLTTLRTGGAVSLYSEYVVDGTVTVDWTHTAGGQEDPVQTRTLVGSVQEPKHPLPYAIFMLGDTADGLGISYAPTAVMTNLDAPPTVSQQDRARAELGTVSDGFYLRVETGPSEYAAAWAWGLLGLTSLIALAAAIIAIGLARSDGHRDSAVLSSLGASPRVRRAFGFWQAVVIAGLGTFIGAVLGLVPSLALALPRDTAGHSMFPFAPPWLQLFLLALALPGFIAVGSWLTAGATRTRFAIG